MHRVRKLFVLCSIFLIVCNVPGFGQVDVFNHSELIWKTIETEHFFVHFHRGTDRTAALVAKIGEEIYDPITTLYQYDPDTKIHFVIKDYNDYANGAAFYYDNKIEFWAPAVLDFPFRGTHSWLRNTITHEFSHMISLGAARKFSRQIPVFYFQWLGYEKEKRKDVIHGYPNTLVSIPYPGTIAPMWFAEGLAQYQRAGLDYETWDTHRDMLLRTAVLAGKAHDLNDMGYFGKNSLGNERVYNQGYGFTKYLASNYGESGLRDVTRAMHKKLRINFSKAAEEVLGKSDRELYNEWMSWLNTNYSKNTRTIRENRQRGWLMDQKGIANFYAAWSPDGWKIAYLSNRGRDYLTQRSLWVADMKTGRRTKIMSGVTSSVSWSSDSKQLIYAKHDLNSKKCQYFDLFIYNLESEQERQITRSKRARQPDWSPDGSIVCVVEQDGCSNLALVSPAGGDFRQITRFHQGESIHLPRWMPDGRIVFSMNEKNLGRDIAMIDSSGQNLTFPIQTEFDERDAWPDPEGRVLYYASDRSGIFNLYCRNLTTLEDTLLTNVIGGAFLPSVNKRGQCVFSRFDADGFKLAFLDSLEPVDPELAFYQSPYAALDPPPDSRSWDIAGYDDTKAPDYPVKPYRPVYGKLMFLPRIAMDFPNKPKIGFYTYNSEFLDQFSFFGGVAANSQFDTDLFSLFEYRKYDPTFFLELYWVRRQTSENETYISYDAHYNLFGATLGADYPLNETDRIRTALDYSRYRSSGSGIVKHQNVFFKFASTYHKGTIASVAWKHRAIPPTLQSHIAPRMGRHFTLQLDLAMQSFYDSTAASSQYGTPVDVYKDYRYFQTYLDWYEFLPGLRKSHSIALRLRGGHIDRRVDPFYHLYAGGLEGMKGYPFYSMEGRKLAHIGAAYLFPLKRNMNVRLAMFHLRDVYLSLYSDAGDAWIKDELKLLDWKRDVGVQLRLGFMTYYSFPMKVAVDATYGLDSFQIRDNSYGREWRFYFTMLFDFLDLAGSNRHRLTGR
ncbi:PD40 domain-containing protein [bacterium]|nr:PD40 domain-containing protein [bacterium]